MNEKKYYENIHKIGNFESKLLFFLLTVLLPLYFDSRVYTALIEAKANCYEVIAAIGIIGIVVYIVYALINQPAFNKEKPIFLKNKLDLAVIFFAVAVTVSCLLSADIMLCMTGDDGFHCGTFMVLSCVAFYFFISRNLIADVNLWEMVFYVMDIILLWAILQSMSIDVFSMHANIVEYQYFDYFATIGQMDSVSAYLCLMMPIGVVFYLSDDKKRNRQFYGLFVMLALMTTFCIQTDGIFIGLAFAGLFLFPYIFSDNKRFVRMFDLGIMAGVDLLILSVLRLIAPDRLKADTSSVTYHLIKYWAGLIAIIFCVVVIKVLNRKRTEVSAKARKIFSMVVVAGIGMVIVGYAIYSVFHFDGGWGNGRGSIWYSSVKMFKDYSLKEKLFGLGTEMIRDRLSVLVNWNVGVANCHNNVLEALLCIGIVGFAAYLLVWVAIVAPFFKKERLAWSRERMAYLISLVAYFGQSIVGNPYSVSVPLVFLVLALYRNQEYRIEKPVELNKKKKKKGK